MNVDHASTFSSSEQRTDYDIFISYSRRDKDFVRHLWESLTQKAKQKVWVDWEDIPPTADWRQEIYLGIEAANNFIFVISPHSVRSVVCGEELAHAIEQGKRLVPIVREDVDYESVHPELARLNWIFFREVDGFDTAFQTLIRAIEIDLSHVRSHTRLFVRAKEWQNKDRDSSFLLRGSDLEAAEQWLSKSSERQPPPIKLHREYIRASREAETERKETEIRLHRLTPQEYRNRQALLSKVRNYWVKGVLETSLHDRTAIALSLEEHSQAVASPWNLAIEELDASPKLLPEGMKIISLFDEIGEGRTLLILGNPGAGKTTTLLELTRDSIERAERDVGFPIPVVFNLSSWASQRQAIAHWLVKELSNKYQVPQLVGQTWVNKQQLLLLIDGLDEVEAKYREECIAALNAFHQEYGLELVVTSRIREYTALSTRLNFQKAVYLRSLTPQQILHYLDNSDSELAQLSTLIHKDEVLLQLSQSPLMLNIMMMAYEDLAPAILPETALLEERRRQLFEAYIERMFKRRGIQQQYSKVQTLHWLSWLAQRMSQFSQTVFLIEGMQPPWLQTPAQHRAYHTAMKLLLMGVWGSLHVGLLAGLRDDSHTFNVLNGLQGLLVGFLGAVIYSLIGGPLGGLVNESTNHLVGRSINALLLGLIYGPIFSWVYGWKGGVAYGLIYGAIGAISYKPLHEIQNIESVATLIWSWRKARNYSVVGLAVGLALYLGARQELISSLIFGLMFSLIFGFEKVNEVGRKTVPNQGIWQSLANAGRLFVTIGLPTGLVLGVVESPIYGAANGLLFGLASGLLGGRGVGIACIKHFTLRCILWWSGYIPWNYARFLDYAVDRVFLQKVGGGYVFIHRLMLEHFAQLELERER